MATKEAVAVFINNREVWEKYIAKISESYVMKVHGPPKGFPTIVIERLTEGFCSTYDAQIYAEEYTFNQWVGNLTDYHLKDAVKRWELDVQQPVGDWAKESTLPF